MTEPEIAEPRGGRGRPVSEVDGDEPGRSYVIGLRRWPDEVANISRTELAGRLGIQVNSLSEKLNAKRWNPTDSLLTYALEIIRICGGTQADLDNWRTYHNAVREYIRTGSEGEPPTPPEPFTHAPVGPSRKPRRRITYAAVLGAIILTAASLIWVKLYLGDRPLVKIKVFADPDELVTTPALRDTMGNYATALPITKVPPPPDGRDQCANRYQWAHGEPIHGMDAGSSIAKIDITALESDIKVDRAALMQTSVDNAPSAMTMLACPGRGGPVPPHLMTADLDSETLHFFPNGGDTPGNFDLRIAKGQTESILLIGTALQTHRRWRLELGGDDGEHSFEYTIGPDRAADGRAASNPEQRPFETIGEFLATPYRFRSGAWQPGR